MLRRVYRFPAALLTGLALASCGERANPELSGADATQDASDAGADVIDAAPEVDASDETAAAPLATSPGKDEDPCIIRAQDGTYHVVWFSDRGGQEDLYIKSSSNGRDWSADRAITNDAERDFFPSLIQTKDGHFHLVWFRIESTDAGAGYARVWTMDSSDLVKWSTPRSLTDPGVFAWAPTIAERVPGELCVSYASDAAGDLDVWLRTSKNGGVDWGAPVKLTDASFNDDIPSIVGKGDGALVLSWQRYDVKLPKLAGVFSDPSNEMVYATSKDGSSWSAPIAVTADSPGKPLPDVIGALFPSDDATGFSLAWTSTRVAGAEKGDVFTLGLSRAPVSATNAKRVTTGSGSDYSAHLAPTSTPGLYLMVWVSDGGGSNLDIYHRFVRP